MIPGISGGQGGVDLSSGPAESGASSANRTGGPTFYFADPNASKAANVNYLVIGGLVLGGLWLIGKRR